MGLSNIPAVLDFLAWWKDFSYTGVLNTVAPGSRDAWAARVTAGFGDAPFMPRDAAPLYRASLGDVADVAVEGGIPVLAATQQPMVMYHYGGYEDRTVGAAENDRARAALFASHAHLKPLHEAYEKRVASYDAMSLKEKEPPFSYFDNGLRVPGGAANNVYRRWYAALPVAEQKAFGNPFSVAVSRNFDASKTLFDELFINECADGGSTCHA